MTIFKFPKTTKYVDYENTHTGIMYLFYIFNQMNSKVRVCFSMIPIVSKEIVM